MGAPRLWPAGDGRDGWEYQYGIGELASPGTSQVSWGNPGLSSCRRIVSLAVHKYRARWLDKLARQQTIPLYSPETPHQAVVPGFLLP